jgi:hypothetical protein
MDIGERSARRPGYETREHAETSFMGGNTLIDEVQAARPHKRVETSLLHAAQS